MFPDFPKLKVTIADSSSYSRLILSSILQAQPDLEVLDTASDEPGLIASLRRRRPDVVLADLGVENKDRSSLLRQIYLETGLPVLMLCDREKPTDEYLLKANKLGVYDYILKPAHRLQPRLREIQTEILAKLRAVRISGLLGSQNGIVYNLKSVLLNKQPKGIVVIGASTGGTQAIEKIIRNLNGKLEACLVIAVHLPAGFTSSFAQRLQNLTSLKVVEGVTGKKLEKGKIIIAPGGRNMEIIPCLNQPGSFEIKIAPAQEDEYDKPSVNVLMQSVAHNAGSRTLGIVLTGMGKDGTRGLEAIKKNGGLTMAQDQESSVIFGMAKSAIDKGYVAAVLPLSEIADSINKFVAGLPAVPEILPTSN